MDHPNRPGPRLPPHVPLRLGILLAWILSLPTLSPAGPPLSTGDVPTAVNGILEIYAGQHEQTAQDGTIARETETEFAYGVNDQLECSMDIAYLRQQQGNGWGDPTVGMKWMFLPESAAKPGLAFSLKCELPTASADKGLGRGAPVWAGRFRAQKTWGRFTGMANLGYSLVNEPVIRGTKAARVNPWFTAFAAEIKLAPKTALLAEIFWQTREKPGASNRIACNIGFKQKITSNLRLHGAIGKSLRDHNAAGPKLNLFIGFKYELAVRTPAQP